MFRRKTGLVIAALGAALVCALTLGPLPGREALARATPLACLVCGELGGIDVILNLLLFAPLGIGLGLLGMRPGRAVLLAFGLSLAVELLQMKVVVGRDASLSDLLTNSAGVLIGLGFGRTWRSWVFPEPARARLLAAIWSAGWLAMTLATAAALAPSPTADPWYGQWAPELGHLERFEGRIQSARLGEVSLPPYRLADTVDWSRRLLADTMLLHARVTLGQPTPGIAPIVSVFDQRQREILLLGQWARDAVFRVRMRPTLLRLRPWTVRLPEGLALAEGTPVEIEAGLEGPRYVLRVEWDGGRHSRVLPFSPHWTWAALLPVDYAFGNEAGLLTALWLAGLALPLGWWAGRAGGRTALVAVLGLGAGIAGVRLLFGLAPAPLAEWVGGLLGFGVGRMLANGVRIPRFGARLPTGELRNPAVDR